MVKRKTVNLSPEEQDNLARAQEYALKLSAMSDESLEEELQSAIQHWEILERDSMGGETTGVYVLRTKGGPRVEINTSDEFVKYNSMFWPLSLATCVKINNYYGIY